MNFRSKLKSIGYDQEEAYFHQKDRELIRKINQSSNGSSKLSLVKGGKGIQSYAPRNLGKKTA